MLDKVKAHIMRHKSVYLIGSYIAVAGITYAIMKKQPRPMWGGVEPTPNWGSANTASFSFLHRSPQINVTTVLERSGRGHPGWPVQNLETKQVFFSQKQAAKAFDISEGILSGHLKGKFPNAEGWHFQKVSLPAA